MTDAADDLEALFDEVSAQRTETVAAAPAAAEPPAPAGESAIPAEAPVEDQSGKPIYERLVGVVR